MNILSGWSDLLIERGTRDPLGLWRVGDRMINELLGPFTTVVTNRPARYLSMYCWILLSLENDSKLTTKQSYWEKFYRLETFLICAITLHPKHDYLDFRGQIGSDTANQLIEKSHDGFIDLDKFKGIKNGWNTNYKSLMFQFNLIESDISNISISGIILTELGQRLGKAYKRSLIETTFLKQYISANKIPLKVIEELSDKACTCRLHHPECNILNQEKELCIQLLKSENEQVMQTSQQDNLLKNSIALILNTIQVHHLMGLPFTLSSWRKFLSTELINLKPNPQLTTAYNKVFRLWQFYNIDSLLTYSLEQGLNGILEFIHSIGGSCKEEDFDTNAFSPTFNSIINQPETNITPYFTEITTCTIKKISRLPSNERNDLEIALLNSINNTSGKKRVIYSYLFFIYVNSLYLMLKDNCNYKEAFTFYFEKSNFDGKEISLDYTLDNLMKSEQSLLISMSKLFVKDLIINRQLSTRDNRNKEQAWISYTSETKTYEWENNYTPKLYRAARLDIFLSYLYSLNLVEFSQIGWKPTVDLSSIYRKD